MVSSKPCTPCHAPSIAPTIAAMVSVSPPTEAAKHKACVGSSKKRVAMAKAAATDSFDSTLVPQSRCSTAANSSSLSLHPSVSAQFMKYCTRASTEAFADQLPRCGSFCTNSTARCKKSRSPSTAKLTAAATKVVASMPCTVLCVTTQDCQAASASAWPGRNATPTGVARIAPPLVVPNRPVSSGLTPSVSFCSAALVEGPSRSSDPLAFIAASHCSKSWAYRPLSMQPLSAISRCASTKACSVSSVTAPAFIFGAIGCCGTAFISFVIGPP